jgi:alkaline phosphatase domain-containing protein
LLEQGRIVTWLDRNSEYADDLDAVQELLDGATLITINANLFKTKLRIFAEDTKSRYAPFFKSSARVADLKKHLAGIADADKRSDRKTFLAAMSAVLLKTQQRSFSVLFAKLATASSVDGNDPLKALKWGLDAYFWEGAHAIWGYEGEHTFDALMTWLFVMNARGWDYRHNSAQRERRRKELWFDDTKALWDAARAGAHLLTHLRALPGIAFSDAAEGFARYTAPDGGLWTIDQEYRHYVRASRAVHVNDVLTDLDRHVENAYRDDYLRPLSRTWDDALRGMRTWDIAVPSSSGRIDSFHRLLVAGSHRRTVVIISDALRYEAGVELADKLRSLGRGAVSVNPWYTMAASGSHFTYMLGRVDQDHYDAARACMVPTQEELDYPQYFTSHSDADERGSGQRGGEELSDGLPKSDGVVNASGDSRPASPVFDRRALLKARAIPRRYKIEPSMGHSMPGILLPYLFDAAEIQIRDPYLRKPHQIRNVHEILLLLIQHADAARLPHVVIETCASDEDEYRAKQEATFEQLQQSWGQFGIVIDWSIVDNFHDRSIVTDTGWVIDLGRGLDVYEAYTPLSQFDPRYAIPQLRRTKDTTINVSRDTEGHA